MHISPLCYLGIVKEDTKESKNRNDTSLPPNLLQDLRRLGLVPDADLPEPVTTSHEVHLHVALGVLLPHLLVLALALEHLLDALGTRDRVLCGLLERRDDVGAVVRGLRVDVVVCVAVHLLFVESMYTGWLWLGMDIWTV